MDPETISVLEKLLEKGETAGMLFLAVWFLARTLKSQYDARISALESHVSNCEKDRLELHRQNFELQRQFLEVKLRNEH